MSLVVRRQRHTQLITTFEAWSSKHTAIQPYNNVSAVSAWRAHTSDQTEQRRTNGTQHRPRRADKHCTGRTRQQTFVACYSRHCTLPPARPPPRASPAPLPPHSAWLRTVPCRCHAPCWHYCDPQLQSAPHMQPPPHSVTPEQLHAADERRAVAVEPHEQSAPHMQPPPHAEVPPQLQPLAATDGRAHLHVGPQPHAAPHAQPHSDRQTDRHSTCGTVRSATRVCLAVSERWHHDGRLRCGGACGVGPVAGCCAKV